MIIYLKLGKREKNVLDNTWLSGDAIVMWKLLCIPRVP